MIRRHPRPHADETDHINVKWEWQKQVAAETELEGFQPASALETRRGDSRMSRRKV
jgi:hypothetical protein